MRGANLNTLHLNTSPLTMGLSFDVLRVGKKYSLFNYGERFDFEIERIQTNGDFRVKDLHTLERYLLKEHIKFGTGKDFEIRELSQI